MERGKRALQYASRYQWQVFPLHHIDEHGVCSCGMKCASPGKHPRVNWQDAATSDTEQIEKWWSRWPDANIGIATGPRSNLFVLDVDVKDSIELGDGSLVPEGDFTLEQLEREHGDLPATLVAQTGSGGRHFYFTYPGTDDYGNRTRFADGLDIRAEGGYVVGPGSNHTSGHDYEWVVRTVPTRPPGWLLGLVSGSTRPVDPLNTDRVAEGGRNDFLARIAGRWRGIEGVDEPTLFGILMSHNARYCDPPLDVDEVQQVTRSAMKFKENTPDPIIMLPAGAAHMEVEEGADLAWPLADFMGRVIEPPKVLVQDLFDAGTGIMIAGPPNVGKSWIVMQLALALSTGTEFLGRWPVEQSPVLFIDEEGHDWGDQRRLEMLINGHDIGSLVGVPMYLSVGKGLKLDDPRGLATVRRMIKRYDAKLVVMDSLVRVHSGTENESRAMAQFFEVTNQLKRTTGASFLFVHHVRKEQAERPADVGEMLRGSSEIKAWLDTLLVVLPGDGGLMEVHVNKQRWREKPEHPFAVRLLTRKDEPWATLGYQGPIEKEDRSAIGVQNRIMTAVQQVIKEDGEPTIELIAAMVNLSIATTKDHLGRMTAARILRVQNGSYGKKLVYRPTDSDN